MINYVVLRPGFNFWMQEHLWSQPREKRALSNSSVGPRVGLATSWGRRRVGPRRAASGLEWTWLISSCQACEKLERKFAFWKCE